MQAVILAAGESSRFWPLNAAHKSLAKIMGKSMIEWTIEGVRKAGINDIIVVQDPGRDIEKHLAAKGVRFVVQAEPKGMGNAILQAEKFLKDRFFVLNPNHIDADFFIKLMLEKQRQRKSEMVLLCKETDNPWNYGILEAEGDEAKNLVEKPERGKEPSNLKVAGIYLLPKNFMEYYRKISEHIYAYEDALRLFMKENRVRIVKTNKDTPTLKYPWDLFGAAKILMSEKLKKQNIAKTAEIAKHAVIEGGVHVGENTKIFENAVVKGPCYIGDNCVIGNNALIREKTNIENGCVIGANCELARTIVQDDTHIHSGYVADSVIGKNCRFGAGVITANVRIDRGEVKSKVKGKEIGTGLKHLGVIVGDNTKFGVGVRLMPGVMIGSDCVIGPGSVVFENVEDNMKFYTKFNNMKEKI